jgi:hypothetical protein
MDKQDNQRDIDTLLQEYLRGSAEPRPLYRNKHEQIAVHINRKFHSHNDTIEKYEQEPNVPLDVFDGTLLDETGRKKGKPLTTEKERRELIDFLKASIEFEERQESVIEKARKELRGFWQNFRFDPSGDTSCECTTNHLHNYLRQYLCKIDNVKHLDMKIDAIILNAINLLINNRNFLIKGQQGQKEREQIDYERYRRERNNVFKLLLIDSIVVGYLTINACKSNGVTETWEWQNITFNEAQIKQVFPIGGEETDAPKIITKAKIGRPQHPVKKHVYELLTEHHQNQNAAKLRPIEVKHRLREKYTKDKSDYSDYSEDVVEKTRRDFYAQWEKKRLAEGLAEKV